MIKFRYADKNVAKPDALHQGGINLFGERFGDYNQAIVMRLDCTAK